MKSRYLYFRLLICICVGFIPLHGVDRLLYDAMIQLQRDAPAPSNLAILQFDRSSLKDARNRLMTDQMTRIEQPRRSSDYPVWDDTIYYQFLTRLQKASPQIVIMTYPFPATIDETRTRLTSDAVRSMKMVWASRLLPEGGVEYPPGALTPYSNYGFGDFFPDPDGVLRQIPLFRSGHVNLGLRVLRELGEVAFRVDLEASHFMKFHSDVRNIPRLTLAQVLFQPIDTWEKFVKDRIIYVEIDSPDLPPLQTPKGKFTRAELHASVLIDLLSQQDFVHVLPRSLQILLVLTVLSLTAWMTLKQTISRAGLLVLFEGTLCITISWALLNLNSLWVPMATPLFTMILTYALVSHYQLMRQEELHVEALQEAENIRKVDEMKSNYMSLFSHDLKTPVSKIDAICERILRTDEGKGLTDKIKGEFRRILDVNHQLKSYISNILNLTKVESGQFKLNRTVCDLNALIEDVVGELKPLIDEKQIRLHLSLDPLFTMELDTTLIHEVVMNLIENAVKYSSEKTVVDVKTYEEDSKAVFSVRDLGHGIPPDEVKQVTDKFYRGRLHRESTKGSGLGLYLVKYFTELHGGEFALKSELGQGTRVEIRLPVE